jgi:hypothetical protein
MRLIEVRFADGRESKFFYWDDLPSRRLRPEILTRRAGAGRGVGGGGGIRTNRLP